MIYIASPYSSPDSAVREQRYIWTLSFTHWMTAQGTHCFSPIVYYHEMAVVHDLPTDAEFWYRFNVKWQRMADEFVVLTLPGWTISEGMRREYLLAKTLMQDISFWEHSGSEYKPATTFGKVPVSWQE